MPFGGKKNSSRCHKLFFFKIKATLKVTLEYILVQMLSEMMGIRSSVYSPSPYEARSILGVNTNENKRVKKVSELTVDCFRLK